MQNFTSESEIPTALLLGAVSTPHTRGSDEMPEAVYMAAEYILRGHGITAEYNGERVVTEADAASVSSVFNQFSVWHVETEYKNNNHIVTRAIRGYDGQ